MSLSKSPFWVFTPTPENMTKSEEDRFWRGEYEKWIEGVGYMPGTGIPGSLYFFWQQQYIKHRVVTQGRDAITRPLIRDVEFIMHHNACDAEREGKAILFIKGTGVGLSTFGASKAVHTAVTKPGSTSLLTSHTQKTLGMIFNDKIIEPMEKCDEHIIRRIKDGKRKGSMDFETLNASSQRMWMRMQMRNPITMSDAISTIDCRETSEKPRSPQNFAGIGANFAYVDEFCVHKRRKEVYDALVSRMRDANTRKVSGLIMLGGAIGAGDNSGGEVTSSDVQEVRRFIEDADTHDVKVVFLPFWLGFNCHLNNGHSDKEGAMKWWEEEAEKKLKSSDSSAFRNFKLENPRTMDDLFDNVVSDRWEEPVAAIIRDQFAEVQRKAIPLQKCSSVFFINNQYKFTEGKEISILEPPKQGVRYIANYDGVQASELTSAIKKEKDRSKLGFVITKLIDPATHPYMPVLTFEEYPGRAGLDASVYKTIDILNYYNRFGGLIKINAERNGGFGELLARILIKEGLSGLIAKKKNFGTNGYTDTKDLFYYRSEDVKNTQYMLANAFLKKYISSIQMMPLLEQMMAGAEVNTDLLDAWLGIFETMPDIGEEKPKPKILPKPTYTPVATMTENGLAFKVKPGTYRV